jgi:membrane-bound lytic murein transglycosylase D
MRNERVLMCRVVSLVTLILVLCGGGIGRAEEEEDEAVESEVEPVASVNHFPYPASLQPQVEFWKRIFTKYSKFQVVIHDAETMKVYKVLDFQPLIDEMGLDESTVWQMKQDHTKRELEHVRTLLRTLHNCNPDCDDLGAEEKKIWNMYSGIGDSDKFLRAAGEDRLRAQTGIKDKFAEAIRVSRRYIKAMESIFRQEGVPVELTRLPFIESSFNVQAYSKVGAAGIWQFMPATGRSFNLRINHMIDERRDPLIASQAAARLLKANYGQLGTWPLAITAYNHGPGGMAAAVDAVNSTDIATIIKRYKGKHFGFASRNFYPEFLAAIAVEKNYREHFGSLRTDTPLVHDTVSISVPVPVRTAAHFAGTDMDALIALNPAWSDAVRANRLPIPHNYTLRLPAGARPGFARAYSPWQVEESARLASLEQARKARLAAAPKNHRGHVVTARSKGTGSKRHVLSSGKKSRGSVRVVRSDGKARKRRS